ncbi:hypothetical protein DSM104440_02291 [Usitatibacter palustris]|uniref:Uncharacterized protein n=1 Tax=Usitatibacter palustris TaxID=2732487 RepID=A0A6M4H7D8_9PROT|nr:hypothetical protein DSM104440_02291 [Usitatibacter palustris]
MAMPGNGVNAPVHGASLGLSKNASTKILV